MVDGLLDKLQQATETFALDQEIRLEQFRAQMEKLFVEQQRSFEQNSEAHLTLHAPSDDDPQTTYVFDSQPCSQTTTEDDDMLDADGTDLSRMVSAAESDVLVSRRTSIMPLPRRNDRSRSEMLYFDDTHLHGFVVDPVQRRPRTSV